MSELTGAADATEIVTKETSRSVSETVAQLKELLEARGIKLFAVIDQQAEAQQGRARVARDHARHLRQPGCRDAGDGGVATRCG